MCHKRKLKNKFTFLLATMVIIPVLIVVAARAYELGLQEKELKHEIEHDVEERKLEEKLRVSKADCGRR
ncbi:hypothetical protein CsSME_00003368 [Camellia sinensis var. sinensis]